MHNDDTPARGAVQPFNSLLVVASDTPILKRLFHKLERQEERDKQRFLTSSQRLMARPMTAAERDAFRLGGRPLPESSASTLAVVISHNGGKAHVAIPLCDKERLFQMTEDEIIRMLDGPGKLWGEAILAGQLRLADSIAEEFRANYSGARNVR